jgi:hypothetical protein
MSDSKPVLITWTFNTEQMKPIMGCYQELTENKHTKAAKMMFLRCQMAAGGEQAALFHVPKDMTRDDFEEYFKTTPPNILMPQLKKAKVRDTQIIRNKDPRGNTIDFLK